MASLSFKGKQFVQNHHLMVKYHELVPKKTKSLTDKVSLHDNLIIHGDNLAALKALLPTYAGKVKCVYIDPPYNTGNESWVYNDNVNSPMIADWLGKIVDREDLTRHDKWLCMMMPRLKLLRELMRDDGVIFVSIDDNEVHHLRMLMDEVFGEVNFLAQFVWKRRTSSALAEKLVSVDHEYVLCYQKNLFEGFLGVEKDYNAYKNPDNDPRGEWMMDNPTVGMTKEQRPNQFYNLVDPKTGRKYPANPNRVWAWIPETMKKLLEEGRIIFPTDQTRSPMFKRYKNDLKTSVNPISTWIKSLSDKDGDENGEVVKMSSGINAEATKLLQNLMGSAVFQYSKPLSLIKSLIKYSSPSDSIILDSFAGSGTTAHAVLALNKEDGGSRKFICVEMEDYADTITAERVRRVIKGVGEKKKKSEQKLFEENGGLKGTFSYFELGKPIEMESVLEGDKLPTYNELARYVFYTATGEEFDESKVNEKKNFVGASREYEVYLFYKPDVEYLKSTALTLERAQALGSPSNKRRLVFAPTKYLDAEQLSTHRIDFAQLPFEIYKLAG